ncbi:FadR/GntR family transcriptional regulator [Herbiconiux sp. A18JL235]|uniref:FadR/GntR family transcriptional regulator n=1 Tax=Herbiconiux sp. A18JL235 TaxID=3152363 RepID=A0AB39BET6_9MICO
MMTAPPPVTPVDTARAWEVVLRHIESELVSGALKPGEHLPSERALAADLGVGRSSVREALRVLEVLGLIRTQTGSGPSSGAVIIARPSGGMAALVRLQVAASGFAVDDVVKTRVVLESAVAEELAGAFAAAAAAAAPVESSQTAPSGAGMGHFAPTRSTSATTTTTAPELGPARELLDAMERPGGRAPDWVLERDEFLTLDQAFHRALAVASGNEVIASMMTGLRDSIEAYVRVGAAFLPSWPDTARQLKAEHRAIVAAIEAGDADAARTRIRDHIEQYHHETTVARAQPH